MLKNNILLLIIIVVCLSFIYYRFFYEKEYATNVTSESLSNEGIQTMVSVLNSGQGKLSNLEITGTLTVGTTVIKSDGTITAGTGGKIKIDPSGTVKVGDVTINPTGSISFPSGWVVGTAQWGDGYVDHLTVKKITTVGNVVTETGKCNFRPGINADLSGDWKITGNLDVSGDAYFKYRVILSGTENNKWLIDTIDKQTLDFIPMNENGWIFSDIASIRKTPVPGTTPDTATGATPNNNVGKDGGNINKILGKIF